MAEYRKYYRNQVLPGMSEGATDQMKGLPRHLGQHTGGVVISAGRLDEVVPIEPAAMAGRSVIQWDKDDCADLGIIKIDLLGLGMLDALEQAIPMIRDNEGVDLDLSEIPFDDPAVYELFSAGDTDGIFQFESSGMKDVLRKVQPQSFLDIAALNALYRPGPMQFIDDYSERRHGRPEPPRSVCRLPPIRA